MVFLIELKVRWLWGSSDGFRMVYFFFGLKFKGIEMRLFITFLLNESRFVEELGDN